MPHQLLHHETGIGMDSQDKKFYNHIMSMGGRAYNQWLSSAKEDDIKYLTKLFDANRSAIMRRVYGNSSSDARTVT